ncbi:MAG: DNA methyltransferase [Ignavibacteria bacterium]|nr:DNA methyltransferase [Ignavibacteria bacterium]
MKKEKAPYNRTLELTKDEEGIYHSKLIQLNVVASLDEIVNRTIHQDMFAALDLLPDAFCDLIFVDPPYNLRKSFNKLKFAQMEDAAYENWLDSWVSKLPRLMKENASIYLCGDWKSSPGLYNIAKKYFLIQNRITWEREKGRGAKANWKNCSEDIWFCTKSSKYTFNLDAVKTKRKVLAPYKEDGIPKDWSASEDGNFRLTSPSNIWTDITIPFWSMPENTDHPTQKPEKLLAKIILASSNEGDVVFDPFLGSGTTSVTAKKLKRNYVGIEADEFYCCLAEKRLAQADKDKSIQGFADGVFWERNSLQAQKKIGN